MEPSTAGKPSPSSPKATKDSASTTRKTGTTANGSLHPDGPRWRRLLWPLYRQYLLRSKAPILVGPYRGEVGFEALYWIPWVQQLIADGIDPARLIPISRGGAAAWYGCPIGLELFLMRTPQEVRVETKRVHRETGMVKQMWCSPFDRAVLKDAAKTLGLRRYHVLHPAWMYQDLFPFFDNTNGIAWLQDRTTWADLPAPALPEGLELPEKFVCARFYARPTFPNRPDLDAFTAATIAQVAQEIPVIVLNNGLFLDDHFDFKPPDHANVTKLADRCALGPDNNLAIQSAVIARSQGFIGTYGGLSQLALRYRKPVIAVYHEWFATCLSHKHLSDALAIRLGVPFHVLKIGDLPLLQSALPKVVAQTL